MQENSIAKYTSSSEIKAQFTSLLYFCKTALISFYKKPPMATYSLLTEDTSFDLSSNIKKDILSHTHAPG